MSMIIIPALLESEITVFEEKLKKLVEFAAAVQVDFDDGSFGGNRSLGPEEVAAVVARLPKKVNFEAHLMVQKPRDYTPGLLKAEFNKIFVEAEIDDDLRGILEEMAREDVAVGLALGPGTSVYESEPVWEYLDAISVLTVEPGRQGQQFLAENLSKVKLLREAHFPGEVEVDGGINEGNIREVAASGPDVLVVGHYIVADAEPRAKYEKLMTLI